MNKKKEVVSDELTESSLLAFLTKCDRELAEQWRQNGCRHCKEGTLHQANFWRKTRGPGIESELCRFSFCCSREGCRKRHTPPSVRFLGPKVYLGIVVVLISAMRHGVTPGRVERLREELGIARRTLQRWREWWLEDFRRSRFWKGARSRFMPALDEEVLPLSLCEAFHIAFGDLRIDALARLMDFLRPLYGPG